MLRPHHFLLACALAGAVGSSVFGAAAPGKAVGTVTIDGTATQLTLAAESSAENLFDSKKKDTIVTLSDRALGDTAAEDDIGLSLKARRGELVAVMLRIDGTKLVNAGLMYKGLSGVVKLPGQWFEFAPAGKSGGTLKLAKRDFDGHAYAMSVEFIGAPAPRPRSTAEAPAPAPARPPTPAPTLAPATTSNIDPKAATGLLVAAMMKKDEHQALELIKLGADPNGRDQSGIPVLNWSVMMCMPQVVKALVDRKASLTYQRAPGMTIMTEAGACPEAAKILSAAGAK